jgi:hypothetical protein
MGNTATKEALIPPAIVTTATDIPHRFDIQINKETQQNNDEDYNTVQTDGSGSGYILKIADSHVHTNNINNTSPRDSMTSLALEADHSCEDYDSVC